MALNCRIFLNTTHFLLFSLIFKDKAMLKIAMSASVVVATLLGAASRAQADDVFMSMFNSANQSAVNYIGTVAINSYLLPTGAEDTGSNSPASSAASESSESSEWISPSTTNQPYEPVLYTVDPTIRAEMIALYVDKAREANEADGEQLAQLFRERDLIAETAQNFRAYGLDINDLGDVFTAYWAVNWGAANQTGRPSIEQVQGLQQQFRSIFASNPAMADASVEERQRIADDMLIRLILVDGAVEQAIRENRLDQLQIISDRVQQSSLATMGVDLAALDLTADGLELR
jgi:hypothetical protein